MKAFRFTEFIPRLLILFMLLSSCNFLDKDNIEQQVSKPNIEYGIAIDSFKVVFVE